MKSCSWSDGWTSWDNIKITITWNKTHGRSFSVWSFRNDDAVIKTMRGWAEVCSMKLNLGVITGAVYEGGHDYYRRCLFLLQHSSHLYDDGGIRTPLNTLIPASGGADVIPDVLHAVWQSSRVDACWHSSLNCGWRTHRLTTKTPSSGDNMNTCWAARWHPADPGGFSCFWKHGWSSASLFTWCTSSGRSRDVCAQSETSHLLKHRKSNFKTWAFDQSLWHREQNKVGFLQDNWALLWKDMSEDRP